MKTIKRRETNKERINQSSSPNQNQTKPKEERSTIAKAMDMTK
jgi:hypothetical protein